MFNMYTSITKENTSVCLILRYAYRPDPNVLKLNNGFQIKFYTPDVFSIILYFVLSKLYRVESTFNSLLVNASF